MKSQSILVALAVLALALGACTSDKQSGQTAQQAATEQPAAQSQTPADQTPPEATTPPPSVQKEEPKPVAPPKQAPAPVAPPKQAPATPPPAAQPTTRMVPLPAGTIFEASLDEKVSTETHPAGRGFTATLTKPATIEGVGPVVPAGSKLRGEVTQSKRAGRVGGKAELSLEFREVTTADGKSYPIFADPLAIVGEGGEGREDAARVVGGTIGGAVIGGLLGGKDGAKKGAAAGAAGGGIWAVASRGEDIVLDPGQTLQVTLQREIRVPVVVPAGTQLP